MATVTGTWADITDTPLPSGIVPELEFRPSKGAVTVGGTLVSTIPVTVTPNTTTGAFTVDLIPTADVLDAGFHYTAAGRWLSPNGYDNGGGHTVKEVFTLKLYVPAVGGNIGALIGKQVGNSLVYAGTDAPTSSEYTQFQLDTDTGDLYEIQ